MIGGVDRAWQFRANVSHGADQVRDVEQCSNAERLEIYIFLAFLSLVLAVGDHGTAQCGGEGRGQKIANTNCRHFYIDKRARCFRAHAQMPTYPSSVCVCVCVRNCYPAMP